MSLENEPSAENALLSALIQHLDKRDKMLLDQMQKIARYNSYAALSVHTQHQKIFPPYKNIHQGKDVVLVASGPSLSKYVPVPDAIHIGVNRAFKFDKVKFDYLFAQDYGAVKDFLEDFCAYDAKKFLGVLWDTWPHLMIPESLALRHRIDRYYAAPPGSFQKPIYDIASSFFWDAHSVVFPVMQFILWTNPRRIFLVGCDCTDGHFDGGQTPRPCDNLIRGWQTLKEFALLYYPETEIISIHPAGLKGMFTDVYAG
jgi:hypothetical protein